MQYLDFEKPLSELEGKAEELRALARSSEQTQDIEAEASALDAKAAKLLGDLYQGLSPWQKCLVARHPERPHGMAYVHNMFTEFTDLDGDRNFAEDRAIIGGMARFQDRPVVVLGHEKGHDTRSRIDRNFGMARPEGYRKAVRLMDLADRFNMPVISLIDTPGAYPGKGAEERGQSEAIARSTQACLRLGVPLITIVIGEGGSGGAVALATGNHVAMLEHSIYSVISPEGCASILWKDAAKTKDAAEALRLTAQDLNKLGVVDSVIDEPVGGAHRDPTVVMENAKHEITAALAKFNGMSAAEIRAQRQTKFLEMGAAGLSL